MAKITLTQNNTLSSIAKPVIQILLVIEIFVAVIQISPVIEISMAKALTALHRSALSDPLARIILRYFERFILKA